MVKASFLHLLSHAGAYLLDYIENFGKNPPKRRNPRPEFSGRERGLLTS